MSARLPRDHRARSSAAPSFSWWAPRKRPQVTYSTSCGCEALEVGIKISSTVHDNMKIRIVEERKPRRFNVDSIGRDKDWGFGFRVHRRKIPRQPGWREARKDKYVLKHGNQDSEGPRKARRRRREGFGLHFTEGLNTEMNLLKMSNCNSEGEGKARQRRESTMTPTYTRETNRKPKNAAKKTKQHQSRVWGRWAAIATAREDGNCAFTKLTKNPNEGT